MNEKPDGFGIGDIVYIDVIGEYGIITGFAGRRANVLLANQPYHSCMLMDTAQFRNTGEHLTEMVYICRKLKEVRERRYGRS